MERTGFIVLLSSQNSSDHPEYDFHWLQRFSLEGEPVGQPLDLDRIVPDDLRGANWEGLSWFEEGKTLVVVHEQGTRPRIAALVVHPPEEWKVLTPHEDTFTHVVRHATEYYLSGPQQGRPPEGTLAAGTKVRLLEDRGSYCFLRTEQGLEAYVATDALRPIGKR